MYILSGMVMDTLQTVAQFRDVPTPSPAAIKSAVTLYGEMRATFPGATIDFESKWAATHAVCSSASEDDCLKREEFEALRRQGPKIIPFIVYKLAKTDDDGQNSWGGFLCKMILLLFDESLIPVKKAANNALETDAAYRPTQGADQSTQHLRCCIVELNYQRNQIAEERVNAWKQCHEENWLQSSSRAFTLTNEYEDLLEMGASIIPQIMVAYYDKPHEYWYELLHEIIHGRKTGTYMLNHALFHNECCRFFEEGVEYDQAPEYIQTITDRHFVNGEPWPPGYVFDRWSGQAKREG
ncbi:hypothetical protein F5Y16DRAFT_406235 [Xylariaceae sp. FL0255]|nr:hypothetical protein F5Y16DRAFT_406235 [Xylariaceae sp. FL0255]